VEISICDQVCAMFDLVSLNPSLSSAARAPVDIEVLPVELANQIAAGEVVERPSSVVKELIENSLDAGAQRLEVTIADGGQTLIKVEDDGVGMRREDAIRSLQRHATSKIRSTEELFRIGTLGFRGEALPSIASVSHMELRTKPHGALSGTGITVRGGEVVSVEDVGMSAGTAIEVRELFYNTPARKKFMKTVATESRQVTEALTRIGLSRPDVRVRLWRDGKIRLDLPEAKSIKDRILSVLGKSVYDDMYPTFEFPSVNGVVARGYFTKPGHHQRSARHLFAFVNGRFVQDKTIRAAVLGAYRTLLERGRYPSVVLFLRVPFELVDVNVHPAKSEVRFRDTNAIYRAVYHAIADELARAPWVADGAHGSTLSQVPDAFSVRSLPATLDATGGQVRPAAGGGGWGGTSRSGWQPHSSQSAQLGFAASAISPLPEGPGVTEEPLRPDYFAGLRVIGQFKRQYILCEDANSLVIIDQHAAHERIAFERLKVSYGLDAPPTQPLLIPHRIELDAIRTQCLEEFLSFFARVGMEIEPFGGNSFALKSVPMVLDGYDHEGIIKDALDDLSNLGQTRRLEEALDSVLSRMACHRVVRGPTVLDREECESLLQQMDEIDFKGNCPHGRPVYFRTSLDELERRFERR
jgi:DNA mismatch repair protein MutL